MVTVLIIILGILLFQLLVVLHEYGHFLVAKRNGVDVEEFGLGFPPKIIGKKMGKGIFRSYYTLNWLPLGGFVRLKGENDNAKGKRTYGGSSLWVKTKIILAGVFVNYLTAVLLFTVLAFVGIPRLLPVDGITDEQQFTVQSDTTIIDSRAITSFIADDSPADQAGLELGDQIVRIGDTPITSRDDLSATTGLYEGQTVDVLIKRDGVEQTITPTFRSDSEVQASRVENQACRDAFQPGDELCEPAKGYFGVIGTDFVLQRSTWSAPITGVALSAQYTKVTFQGLWRAVSSLFQGDTATASESVAGPIGIFFVLKEGASFGLRFMLMIIALISLTLAIMNVLPIPALDGGRLMLTLLYRKVLKRPLTRKTEERIVGTSMAFLLGLMLVISIVDFNRFIR